MQYFKPGTSVNIRAVDNGFVVDFHTDSVTYAPATEVVSDLNTLLAKVSEHLTNHNAVAAIGQLQAQREQAKEPAKEAE